MLYINKAIIENCSRVTSYYIPKYFSSLDRFHILNLAFFYIRVKLFEINLGDSARAVVPKAI